MKKSTKLLSVLLAVIMILSSMTMISFAAKANYKNSSDLETAKAYSPNGTVTRLSSEERMSMVLDFLDIELTKANINPGQLFNIVGISLTLDLRSINAVLGSLDNVKSVLNNGLVGLIKGSLGIIADVNFNSWDTGMTRENKDQLYIVSELATVLAANSGVVKTALTNGIDLGLANSALGGVDLSMITDIPGAIKGMLFGMMTRWDDTVAEADALQAKIKGNGQMQAQLDILIKNLLTKPMSIGTYVEDVNGNVLSSMTLPGATADARNRYVRKSATQIQINYYDPATKAYVNDDPDELFTREEILDGKGNGTGEYKYVNEAGYDLQYYYDGSYALRSLKKAMDGGLTIAPGSESAASLLFKFIPYAFEDMATVVLNGSLKKILAEWFGAYFIYEGEQGKLDNSTIPAADKADVFFTQPQGDYIWGFSDYKVINGTPYYRYEDSYYRGVTSGTNEYYDLFNWDYKIPADLFNEFIPGADGNTPSAAGYTTILQGLNDWLLKVMGLVMNPTHFNAMGLTEGDNSNLVANAKKAAQYIVKLAPERIFGKDPTNNEYYKLMTDAASTNQEILSGLAATIIRLAMPQFILPTADSLKQNGVGAILAAVVRELATQFLPGVNYDALIYDNYNTKTLKKNLDNKYWLNVILTIATDIGVKYLQAYIDLGTDQSAWASGMNWSATKTYAASDVSADDATVQPWEAKVDYLIDWVFAAQTANAEWQHAASKLLAAGQTFDPATVQNPWEKLGALLKAALPVADVFNVNTADANWLRTLLRDDFILALVNLDLEKIAGGATATGILNVPTTSVLRTTNTYDAIVKVIRDLLNALLKEVGDVNHNFTLIPTTVAKIDDVFTQSNIATVAQNLVGALDDAYINGLLDVVLPVANLVLGWKTSTQYMAKPIITFQTASGKSYLTPGESATISIFNNSSGMLYKRGDNKYDHSYDIVVDNITAVNGTPAGTTATVQPGTSAQIGFTAGAKGSTRIEVTYHYVFKDGNTLGGQQVSHAYTYVSDTNDNYRTYYTNGAGDYGSAYTKLSTYLSAYTEDVNAISGILSGLAVNIENTSVFGTTGNSTSHSGQNGAYVAYTGATYGGQSANSVVTLYPVKLADGANLDALKSGDQIAIGTFKTNAKWGAKTKSYSVNLGNIMYADMVALNSVYYGAESADPQRAAFNVTDTQWNEFLAAMDNAAYYVKGARNTGTFSSIYTDANITAATTRLKNALKVLEENPSTATTVDVLKAAYEKCDPKAGDAYQNYNLFEYFEYQGARTAITNRIAEYEGPQAPQKYISGESLSAEEIDAILEAETNAKYDLAINGTVTTPSGKDVADYEEALKNWKAPNYSALDNADLAARLGYYNGFLKPLTTVKAQLNTEIVRANAQNYNAADYAEQSWTAYTKALEYANKVNGDATALQNEVFNAKYELMLAQNNLLPKAMSALENPTAEMTALKALIPEAQDIFANPDNYTIKEGVTEQEAYAQLVKALGYKTADGAYLYGATALDLTEKDRELNNYNIWLIGDVKANLEAAMANFVPAAVPDLIPSEIGEGTVIIDETTYCANADGFIYGVNTDYEDLASFLDTPAGSIRITENAMGMISTGATIELLDTDGTTVLATYTYVYFGDVNGDGFIDPTDVTIIEGIAGYMDFDYMAGDGSAEAMAMDINGDGFIDPTDVTMYEGIAGYMDFPTQAEIAAAVAAGLGVA